MSNIRPIHRAYIAGVFDGEGCVYITKDGRDRIEISLSQKEPEVLQWIQEILGHGSLYSNQGKNGAYWRLRFTSKADMMVLIDTIYKYSIVKRKKLSEAKRILKGRPYVVNQPPPPYPDDNDPED